MPHCQDVQKSSFACWSYCCQMWIPVIVWVKNWKRTQTLYTWTKVAPSSSCRLSRCPMSQCKLCITQEARYPIEEIKRQRGNKAKIKKWNRHHKFILTLQAKTRNSSIPLHKVLPNATHISTSLSKSGMPCTKERPCKTSAQERTAQHLGRAEKNTALPRLPTAKEPTNKTWVTATQIRPAKVNQKAPRETSN